MPSLAPLYRFFFLLLISQQLHAQAGDTTLLQKKAPLFNFVGVHVHYGYILAHRYTMGHLIEKHIPMGELDLARQTNGNREWERAFHLPDYGLELSGMSLGNPTQLGYAAAIIPYVDFPLGVEAKLKLRLGWGVGWLTKRFDAIENHKNIAIGSHLNTAFNLRLTKSATLTRSLVLQAGIGITHYSNGAFTLPNLGLNIPTLSLGIYHQQPGMHICANGRQRKNLPSDTAMPYLFHKWSYTVFGTFGVNEEDQPEGPKRPAYGLYFSAVKQTGRKSRFGAGLDVMYAEAWRISMKRKGDIYTPLQNTQLGVKGCYEIVLTRLTLPIEMGVYAYSKYKTNGLLYNRYGIRYQFNEHFIGEIALKTHLVVAEYWELCMGYRF